jgi:hypothetical protein
MLGHIVKRGSGISAACAILVIASPSIADVETTTTDGRNVLTGSAKISLGACRVRWDKPSQEYQLKGCDTIGYVSHTSTNPMTLSVNSFDLNDNVNALKNAGEWEYTAEDPDIMAGCWNLRLNLKTAGDIRPFYDSLGLTGKSPRNTCSWTAQPMFSAGSGLSSSGNANGARGRNQDITALVGSDGASTAIQFFASNPLIGRWSTPSQNMDHFCAQIPPQFVAVTWTCVADPLPIE